MAGRRGATRGRFSIPARRVPALVLAVLMLALTVLALQHEGLATARVDVNDGGIWVTNSSKQLVGHLNYETKTLDGAFRTTSGQFDIGQYKDVVTFDDLATNAVASVDAAGVRLGSSVSLSERATSVQGGERMGVLDPETGNLWVLDAANPAGGSMTEANALATDLEGGVVTTGVDGTVAAISAEKGRFVVVTNSPAGDKVTPIPLTGVSKIAKLSLTMVGAKPVALDATSNTLVLPDGSLKNLTDAGVPTGGRLQQPGPAADHVLLATGTALVSIPLDGGKISTVQAADGTVTPGQPAAPVRLNGCEYAAWSVSALFLRVCDAGQPLRIASVTNLSTAQNPVFRTNRKLIVLNDVTSGTVWLPDKNMVLASDWDEIDSQLQKQSKEEDSPQTNEEIADPERKQQNTPPIATNDAFGVRPGRSTTLDVLSNDSDSDGDILTASPVSQPGFGTVEPTRGGQALRMDVPDNASGTTTFTYQASDGIAVALASVEVTVFPFTQPDKGPAQLRSPSIKLGTGAEVTYNVLPDWRDPEGDPIFLASASNTPDGLLQVQYSEQGSVTVRDNGAKPGAYDLAVSVSDGEVATVGKLTVVVQPPGNLPPTANADFQVARVGETALIQPLANDTDPNGDTLSLAGVTGQPQGTTVVPDLDLGTVSFTARAPGSYSFTYSVSDGPSSAVGVIRVDVVAADTNAPPVAEDDLVLLPQNGAALAAPLNNDTDPTGGVLVLQQINLPASAGIKVTLVDHHLLRITSQVPLEAPVDFTYIVSNGVATAEGKVFVVPTHAQDATQAPQTQPDSGKVRVGDIGSVNVLANDRSPAGLTLSLDSRLEYKANPDVGTPFVTGNQVRLAAGTKSGYLVVAYTVRDTAGNSSAGTVTFEVVSAEGVNAAPRPKALTAWAVAGQTVRIPVPLAGIDPNGDSVTLAGIEQPPKLGVAKLGTDWIEYTPASDMKGTDVFTYIVEDRLGKQSVASVRVGIAPPSVVNQSPAAVPDTLLVRPNRLLMVPVLANDVDPDGDPLSLVPDGVQATDERLAPKIVGNSVSVTTPPDAGSYLVTYTVTDGRGGVDIGKLTLNVSPDAPLQNPIARDDVVAVEDVPTDGTAVKVEVLANDEDPDGDSSKLTVTAPNQEGVTVANNVVSIKPDKARRLVVYTITDQDGLTGSAVISVPGSERTRPKVDETKVPVEIRSGQEVTLNLNDYVIVREGRTPHVNDPSSVKASVGAEGSPQLTDDHTIVFKASTSFFGDASVSFTVSDGSSEDRSALTATLTIPIRVLPAENHPPTLTPTPIRVGAGEAPVRFDLTQMVNDPDKQDPATFAYTITATPARLTVALVDGHFLDVGAAVDQPKGDAGSVTVAVNDGSGPVVTTIPVTVTASSKPLVQTSEAKLIADAGKVVTLDLTTVTTNPFPTPLRVVGSPTVLEGPLATVDVQGTRMTITPNPGTHGTLTISYQVMDATGDPDRIVSGTVIVQVRDVPEPPTGVTVVPNGAGSAIVTWQPGNDNGAPIQYFLVTDVGYSTSRTSSNLPSITMNGLTNGVDHTFTVVAVNEVGESAPSSASAPVNIDVTPGRPDPPTMTPGDGSMTVTWSPPSNEGSAVTKYTVSVTGGAGSQTQTVDGSKTSITISGLTNGVPYTASVVASNKKGDSEPSASSAPQIPYGQPPAPTNLAVAYLPPVGAQAAVQLTWALPGNSNGSAYSTVEIAVKGGATTQVDARSNSTTLTMDPQESVTVTVRVANSSNPVLWSAPASLTFTAASVPLALAAPTVTADGTSGTLTVSKMSVAPGNGFNSQSLRIQYSADGGSTFQDFPGGTVSGLTNGTPYALQFRQAGQVNGSEAYGPAVTAASATPYGPPSVPTLTVKDTSATSVTFHWDARNSANGKALTAVKISIGRKVVLTTTDLTGDYVATGSAGQQFDATVQACVDTVCSDVSATVTGFVDGTYSAVPAACKGGELPVATTPPSASPSPTASPCYTFIVKPAKWGSSGTLSCTFVSDINKVAYKFTVPMQSSGTYSGYRTNVTDAATMAGWPTASPPVLTCVPT